MGESIIDGQLRQCWKKNDVRGIAAAIDHGADPNLCSDEGVPLLMSASMAGSVELVRALLNAGAEVDARKPSEQATSLMYVVSLGHSDAHRDIMHLLIAHDADVNARDRDGNSVLDLAVAYRNVGAAESLRRHGASGRKSSLLDLDRLRESARDSGEPRRGSGTPGH